MLIVSIHFSNSSKRFYKQYEVTTDFVITINNENFDDRELVGSLNTIEYAKNINLVKKNEIIEKIKEIYNQKQNKTIYMEHYDQVFLIHCIWFDDTLKYF